MRLIDADECERYFYEHLDDNGMIGAMNAINEMPTVQPFIRCHECAKRRTLDCPMGITVFDAPPLDGYCYKADMREGE